MIASLSFGADYQSTT
jgi:choline transport protein